MYHDNQNEAASSVEMFFQAEHRHVILTAQMQSGKTGTFHNIIERMHTSGLVSKSILLCGMSDENLYNQAVRDASEYNSLLVDTGKLKVKYLQHLNRFNISGTFRDALIIIDESDRDSKVGSRMDKLLSRAGIPINGNTSILKERNIYIVSVSATPFAEYSDVVHKNSHEKSIVHLRPGTNYIGIKDNVEHNNFHPIFDIEGNPIKFKDIVERGPTPKYSIIRYDPRSIEFSVFKKLANENGWGLFVDRANYHQCPEELPYQIDSINAILSTRPTRPSLILVHGKYRAGIVLSDKQYIQMVWENSKAPKTDTIVQGLIGRVCGYHNNHNILNFVSENLLVPDENGLNELSRFLQFHGEGTPDMDETIYPDTFQHAKKSKKSDNGKKTNTTPAFRIPRELVDKYSINKNCSKELVFKAIREFMNTAKFNLKGIVTEEQHEEIMNLFDGFRADEDDGSICREYLENITVRNTKSASSNEQYKDDISPIQRSLKKSFPVRSNQGIRNDVKNIVVFRVSENYPKEYQDEDIYNEDHQDDFLSETRDKDGERCVIYFFFRTETKSIYTPSDTNGKEIYRYEPRSNAAAAGSAEEQEVIYQGNPSMGITFDNAVMSSRHNVETTFRHLVSLYLRTDGLFRFTGELFNPDISVSDNLHKTKEYKKTIHSIEREYNVEIKITYQRGRTRRDGTRGIKKIEIN